MLAVDTSDLADELAARGFVRVQPERLRAEAIGDAHLFEHAFRHAQDPDPEPGHRWRSHSKLELRGGALHPLQASPYSQSAYYNPEAGGRDRYFRPIEPSVIASATLGELVRFNASLARAVTPDVFIEDRTHVGLHMVSYRPCEGKVATSMPVWLHRDEEALVSVVLFGMSGNLGGGENLISEVHRQVTGVVVLSEFLEQLILTKKPMHAVAPMYSLNTRPAYRNVLLITFKAPPDA